VLLPILREALAPVAEQLASMIAEAADGEVKVPIVLSSERRGMARRLRRARFAHACDGCGVAMHEHQRHRAWCDACLPNAKTSIFVTKPQVRGHKSDVPYLEGLTRTFLANGLFGSSFC
jgi:hypothetical protein